MSNEEQVPVVESNSPVEPAGSSRSVDTEQIPRVNGATEPDKATGSVDTQQTPKGNDSTEPVKVAGSVDTEQRPKVEDATGPDKASVKGEQPQKESGSTQPGKTSESANGKQSHQDSALGPGPKIALDMKDVMAQIVGDNAYVNINFYVDMVQGKSIKLSDSSSDDGAQNKESAGTSELISEALKSERQSTTFFTGNESEASPINLPETEEEFSQWYYGLGDYEQYYVQTAAILYGAPAHEVSKRADSFYKFIRDQVKRREASLQFRSHRGDQRENQQRASSRFSALYLRRVPSRELRISTHTITRWEKDVDCLYWRDVDQFGMSRFGLNLLAFLTKEFISKGEHGQISLNMLKRWSEDDGNDELSRKLSRKAAHSYGVVLWCHNADLLVNRAEEWAIAEEWEIVKSRSCWQRAAELLDGAYEIEQIKGGEKVNDAKTSSVVLRLLDSWVARVHKEFRAQDKRIGVQESKKLAAEDQAKRDQADLAPVTNLACAAAHTYGLIGKRSPEIALAGLQRLFQLPQTASTVYTRRIFAEGVSTYVTLTWSRRVRSVLEHLAANAEVLSHQRPLAHKMEELRKYRQYREVHLNATLEAFFLVWAASYLGRRERPPASYSLTESLPPQPAIPDPDGRDVLLAGLLSQEEVVLREHITTLLCTAIIEKKSRLAFGILRLWAEIVFEMFRTREIESDAVKKLVSFWRFIVNLGKTVDAWCLDLEKQGFRSPQAIDAFKCRLEQWCKEGRIRSHPIGSLAQEVLKQFSN